MHKSHQGNPLWWLFADLAVGLCSPNVGRGLGHSAIWADALLHPEANVSCYQASSNVLGQQGSELCPHQVFERAQGHWLDGSASQRAS